MRLINNPRKVVLAQILRDSPNVSTDTQQSRIITTLLKLDGFNTWEARNDLNIMHPSGRVKELKEQGWVIDTLRVKVFDDMGKAHTIAHYILKGLPRERAA